MKAEYFISDDKEVGGHQLITQRIQRRNKRSDEQQECPAFLSLARLPDGHVLLGGKENRLLKAHAGILYSKMGNTPFFPPKIKCKPLNKCAHARNLIMSPGRWIVLQTHVEAHVSAPVTLPLSALGLEVSLWACGWGTQVKPVVAAAFLKLVGVHHHLG